MQSQAIEPAKRTAKDVPRRPHRTAPSTRINVQEFDDRGKREIDCTALVLSQTPASPVHEFEIVETSIRQVSAIVFAFIAERQQGNVRWLCFGS